MKSVARLGVVDRVVVGSFLGLPPWAYILLTVDLPPWIWVLLVVDLGLLALVFFFFVFFVFFFFLVVGFA